MKESLINETMRLFKEVCPSLNKPLHGLDEVTPWHCQKGDVLIQQGDRARTVRFIKTGLCRLYFVDAEGNEQTKYFLGPGYFVVPIHSLFLNVESWFAIQAASDCTGWSISNERFRKLISQDLSWATYWSRYLERLFIEKENRERDFLTLDARGRYEQFASGTNELFKQVPLHQIASYLGMTDVSLSRIRSSRPK